MVERPEIVWEAGFDSLLGMKEFSYSSTMKHWKPLLLRRRLKIVLWFFTINHQQIFKASILIMVLSNDISRSSLSSMWGLLPSFFLFFAYLSFFQVRTFLSSANFSKSPAIFYLILRSSPTTTWTSWVTCRRLLLQLLYRSFKLFCCVIFPSSNQTSVL